jgi:hypothetical protein
MKKIIAILFLFSLCYSVNAQQQFEAPQLDLLEKIAFRFSGEKFLDQINQYGFTFKDKKALVKGDIYSFNEDGYNTLAVSVSKDKSLILAMYALSANELEKCEKELKSRGFKIIDKTNEKTESGNNYKEVKWGKKNYTYRFITHPGDGSTISIITNIAGGY